MASTANTNMPPHCQVRKVINGIDKMNMAIHRSLAAVSAYSNDHDSIKLIPTETTTIAQFMHTECENIKLNLQILLDHEKKMHERQKSALLENFKLKQQLKPYTDDIYEIEVNHTECQIKSIEQEQQNKSPNGSDLNGLNDDGDMGKQTMDQS